MPPSFFCKTRKLIGRHNGKVVLTFEPSDVIFTGTPGTTQAMQPGDTFEVEIEGIGVLRNKVVAEKP